MILLYLTSEKNAGLLDAECAEYEIPIQKRVGGVNLQRFVTQEGANLNSLSHLALDLAAVQDGEDEMIQAIRGLRSMHLFQIVAVVGGAKVDEHFIKTLESEGVRFSIKAEEPMEIKPKARPHVPSVQSEPLPPVKAKPSVAREPPPKVEPTAPQIKSESPVAQEAAPTTRRKIPKPPMPPKLRPAPIPQIIHPSFDPPPQKAVPEPPRPPPHMSARPINIPNGHTVGICGAVHRAGVTTQAFNLASFLTKRGHSVCIVEANAHGHIGQIAPFYNAKTDKRTGAIRMYGVDFYTRYDAALVGKYAVTIFDYGLFEAMDAHSFFVRDVKIVCACTKAWEADSLMRVFPYCEGRSDVNFLFSFVPPDEQPQIRKLMGKHAANSFFSAYMPSLFEPEPNADVYAEIMGTRFF